MVEVVDVLPYQPSQVTLTENDDVIQTLAPDTADEPFAHRVGFRCAYRRSEHFDILGNTREVDAAFPVVVTDQKPWRFPKRRRSAPLLRDP